MVESIDTAPTSVPAGQQETPQVRHFDIKAAQQQLNSLQSDLRPVVIKLHACIGKFDDICAVLDPSPSDDLRDLCMRCWGKDWRSVWSETLSFQAFMPEFVTMSLISAFLHDKILCQQAPAQVIAQNFVNELQASGPLGEEYLRHLDISRAGKFSSQVSLWTPLTISRSCGCHSCAQSSRRRSPYNSRAGGCGHSASAQVGSRAAHEGTLAHSPALSSEAKHACATGR